MSDHRTYRSLPLPQPAIALRPSLCGAAARHTHLRGLELHVGHSLSVQQGSGVWSQPACSMLARVMISATRRA